MSKPRLTPWYPPEIKPVREGWYQCHVCTVRRLMKNGTHYWTGDKWIYSLAIPGAMGNFQWRGLASKP